MTVSIRAGTPADAPALSHICLQTANAGTSAEHLHNYPELPGLVYAVNYVSHIPTTFAFVLVDNERRDDAPSESTVVGYLVGTTDTRTFEHECSLHWYPPLRAKYPLPSPSPSDGAATVTLTSTALDRTLTPADERYFRLLQNTYTLAPECVAFSPAHFHIDLLPSYQRKGWGRRLVDRMVEYLRSARVGEGMFNVPPRGEGERVGREIDGVWLGMDPMNKAARVFYERLGFREIEGAPGGSLGLKLKDWKSLETAYGTV